jgi:hypothetical protein
MPGSDETPAVKRSTVTEQVPIEVDGVEPESSSDDGQRDPRDTLRMKSALRAFLHRTDGG